ncbi:MAG TPA: hypothetical protein VGF96_13160 [Terracidiphilus sp.]|jgi:hypothetical protein
MFAEERVFCQPSWVMQSSTVRAAITHFGAQMGPVHFDCDQPRSLQPYHVSPWQCEKNWVPYGLPEKVLRGDFFCLPFGYAGPEAGMPSHGRTASGAWLFDYFRSLTGVHELRIHMTNALREAQVTRQFFLRDGENVVYDRTTISGLSGRHTLGHHAVLRLPHRQSSLLVSTSKQIFGMTYPEHLHSSEHPEHRSLALGSVFDDLTSVPSSNDSSNIDCSIHPVRRGFTDLLQIGIQTEKEEPAWTAAVNTEDGYLWFSLRDAALLPSTIFWIENEGRGHAPWNGRNRSLGLEDVCSFFDAGSNASAAPNAFSERGIRTVQDFQANIPLSVAYIQGAVRTPQGFGKVHTVRCESNRVSFTDSNGKVVSANVAAGFLFGVDL